MPHTGAGLAKGLVPLVLQIKRDAPSQLVIAKPHANKVPALAGLGAVDEAFASVKDGQVVDEMDVARLGGELKPGRFGDILNCVQGLHLSGIERRQVSGSGMAGASHESGPTKVGDEMAVVVKEDRAALELGAKVRHRCVSFALG